MYNIILKNEIFVDGNEWFVPEGNLLFKKSSAGENPEYFRDYVDLRCESRNLLGKAVVRLPVVMIMLIFIIQEIQIVANIGEQR